MSIEGRGFLSPEIAASLISTAQKPSVVRLAADLNSLAQQELLLLEVASEDIKAFLAALLFARSLSDFLSAILRRARNDPRCAHDYPKLFRKRFLFWCSPQ
jgi:hypothetical protein